MEAGVSNSYALWNVPQCEWRTVVPNTPSHPHIMTVRHSAPPWPLTFRPGGETGAVLSHANIASIWVSLPLTVNYELEPFMSRQLCVTYTRVAIVPSEAVPGRMGRRGQKRPKISFLANNSGHRGRMLEPLCRMMRFCNADIFIMHWTWHSYR